MRFDRAKALSQRGSTRDLRLRISAPCFCNPVPPCDASMGIISKPGRAISGVPQRQVKLLAGRLLLSTVLENLEHQYLDIKHNLDPEPPSLRSCDITYSKFFMRFAKVAGMTGTALDISGVLWDIYDLSVRVHPDLRTGSIHMFHHNPKGGARGNAKGRGGGLCMPCNQRSTS